MDQQDVDLKTCPFCKNRIKEDAAYCPYCQRDIPASAFANPNRPPRRLAQILVGAGALLIIAGTLLPWGMLHGEYGTINFVGYKSDGITALVLGILVAITAIFTRARAGKPSYWPAIFLALVGTIMVVLVIARVISYRSLPDSGLSPDTLKLGIGIYLCLTGNLTALAGGFIKC
jgi:hypothetical protein